MRAGLYFKAAISLALAVITVWVGWRTPPPEAAEFVRHYGYWFVALAGMVLIIDLGIWLILWQRRGPPCTFPKKHVLAGLVTVFAGSAVIFHGATLDYKILMDDYLLSATAKSLHESGEVSVADFGRKIDGDFTVMQSFVDKRPWFYPFLVSLVHDTLGYESIHPFVVNAAIAVLFLGIVFALGHALGGCGGGILSVLLWASLSLVQQNATGAGMEMLNLLMIHVVMLLSIYYLRSPSAEGEGALCLAGVLLTYTRYESGLFLGAILLIIVMGWWRRRQVFFSLPAILSVPFLLAALMQTRVYSAAESSWELGEGVSAPFAWIHLWNNLPHAFAFFWSRDPAIANSLWLGLLALPALIGFGYLCFWKRGSEWYSKPANQVWSIFAVFLLLNLLAILSFHAAQFDSRYVARYSLPAHGLIVFSLVACLACLRPQKWVWLVSIVLTSAFIIGVTLPKNAKALYTKANFMVVEQHWLEALDRKYLSENTLVIDRFNTAWTLRERAALPPHVAQISAERLRAELAAGKYDQILLVERLGLFGAGLKSQLPAAIALKQIFDAELIEAKSFREGILTRVYRLESFDRIRETN